MTEPNVLSAEATDAIRTFMEWLDTTEAWQELDRYEGLYICIHPQLESHLRPLLKALNIPHGKVLKTTGPKYPTLYSSSGTLSIYPLKIEPGTTPTISGQPVGVGSMVNLTTEAVQRPQGDSKLRKDVHLDITIFIFVNRTERLQLPRLVLPHVDLQLRSPN